MTRSGITSLALKLFAIYLLVQMLLAIPYLIASLAITKDFLAPEHSSLWLWGATATAVLVGIISTVFLWNIANKLVSNRAEEVTGNGFPDVEAAVLGVLGLFLAVQAIVHFASVSAGAYVQYVNTQPPEVSLQTEVEMVALVIQGLIGLSLILRTDGWVLLFRRIRTAGVSG